MWHVRSTAARVSQSVQSACYMHHAWYGTKPLLANSPHHLPSRVHSTASPEQSNVLLKQSTL